MATMFDTVSRKDVMRLAAAMEQLLDDMREGKCVSGAAKAQARIAFEPFCDDPEGLMPLDEAKRVMASLE